jgi:hypothetical protein
MPWTRLPSPGVGAALTVCCICSTVMSWQVTASITGAANAHIACAACARACGTIAARPAVGRSPGNARSDLRRGGSCSARRLRAARRPFQSGGQLGLGRSLALAPLAVLIPDRSPAAVLLAGRVHRDPALQLNDFAAASGGCSSGAARDDPAAGSAVALLRPTLLAGPLWRSCGVSVGILVRAGAACAMRIPSLPALSQVRGLTM